MLDTGTCKSGSCINVGAQVASVDTSLFCKTNLLCNFELSKSVDIFDYIRGFVFGGNTQAFMEDESSLEFEIFLSEKYFSLFQLYNFFFFGIRDAVAFNLSSIDDVPHVQHCNFLDFNDFLYDLVDTF